MNERIKELWNYAADTTKDDSWESQSTFIEEFAELIVKECAKVLTQHGAYFSGDGEPYHYAAHLIEEHFGIEE